MEIILKILFFSFNNIDVKFAELEKLIWEFYIVTEALSTISWVQPINKREFTKAALDTNLETFMIYILTLKAIESLIINLF